MNRISEFSTNIQADFTSINDWLTLRLPSEASCAKITQTARKIFIAAAVGFALVGFACAVVGGITAFAGAVGPGVGLMLAGLILSVAVLFMGCVIRGCCQNPDSISSVESSLKSSMLDELHKQEVSHHQIDKLLVEIEYYRDEFEHIKRGLNFSSNEERLYPSCSKDTISTRTFKELVDEFWSRQKIIDEKIEILNTAQHSLLSDQRVYLEELKINLEMKKKAMQSTRSL